MNGLDKSSNEMKKFISKTEKERQHKIQNKIRIMRIAIIVAIYVGVMSTAYVMWRTGVEPQNYFIITLCLVSITMMYIKMTRKK